MKSGQLGHGGPVGKRNPPLPPVVKPLGGEPKLSPDEVRPDGVDEIGVKLGHGSNLHAPFNRSRASSLKADGERSDYTHLVMEGLGDRIKSRLAALELDQTAVAESVGMSVQRLNNYIQGRRTPDLVALVRLASALETTTDWLLGAEDRRSEVAREVLRELLAAAGLPSEQTEAILLATTEAMRLLAVLPGEDDDPLRPRMAARAAWHSRAAPKPN